MTSLAELSAGKPVPAFGVAVGNVVGVGSGPQMLNVDAGGVVAEVHDDDLATDVAVVLHPDEAMHKKGKPLRPRPFPDAVSGAVFSAFPFIAGRVDARSRCPLHGGKLANNGGQSNKRSRRW